MRNPMKSSSSLHKGTKAIPSPNRNEEKQQSKEERSSTKKNASQFDRVTDDVLYIILAALASTATSAADILNALLTSRRFLRIGSQQKVLKRASLAALSVKAENWSRGAETFLMACALAGNAEAAFILGMIYYYCVDNRQDGLALIQRAAWQLHPSAVHALSLMAFNGTADAFSRKEKNVPAGIALSRLASDLGHVDATRQLGHCLISGYGMRKDAKEGKGLLYKASAKARAEFDFLSSNFSPENHSLHHLSFNTSAVLLYRQRVGYYNRRQTRRRSQRLPSPKLYPVNQFLLDWFDNRPLARPLRLCSNEACGLPETWRKEFRRCKVCKTVQYCCRACAGVDWYLRHKYKCEAPEWGGRPEQNYPEDDFAEGEESGGQEAEAEAEGEDDEDQDENEDENEDNLGEEAEYRLVIPD